MWTLSQDITGLLHAARIKYTFTNSLIYLLTYLLISILKFAYFYGLHTCIFHRTQWTDADQSLMIRTLLLTRQHWHGNSIASHPQSSSVLLLPLSWRINLTGRMLSGQSTKTNKATSDATIEARVVKSFACVEWRAVTLLPTGRRLAVY